MASKLASAILDIIESADAAIPDDIQRNHKDLVRAGEYGVALDFVEDWIADAGQAITSEFYQRILHVRALMGQRGRCEDYIKANLLKAE